MSFDGMQFFTSHLMLSMPAVPHRDNAGTMPEHAQSTLQQNN